MKHKRAHKFGTNLPIKIKKLKDLISHNKQSKMLIYLIISMLLLIDVRVFILKKKNYKLFLNIIFSSFFSSNRKANQAEK
jgi:hypothetical protein